MTKIKSSSHYVLFTTKNNTVSDWIDVGRSLEHFLLELTKLGIADGFLNQPCEVKSLAKEMHTNLPIHHEHPMIIARIG